jgi:hypothetical protein
MLATAVTWDPFIRGVLIIVVAVVVLPGSVYLLLSTNLGAKIGFLVALACLMGWIGTMGILWGVYGIGAVGRPASWRIQEVITGDIRQSTTLQGFPKGFKRLKTGEPELGDLAGAGDKALTSSQGQFTAPFSKADQYIAVTSWKKDPTLTWHLRSHKFTPLGHATHVDVLQVRPILPQPDVNGVPAKPVPDNSKPITSVVATRDLGSLRQPAIIVSTSAFITFGVCCSVLHRRDKQILAARQAATASA